VKFGAYFDIAYLKNQPYSLFMQFAKIGK